MYALSDSLDHVKGIGPAIAASLAKKGLFSIQDLVLWLPLRYEDRSHRVKIGEAPIKEIITIAATVHRTSNYYKGPRSIQSALITDETGKLKAMWFNNRFVLDKLKPGQRFLFSGQINERGVMIQPTVEAEGGDTIHTDRLVPFYSQLPGIKAGSIRRLLKQLLDNLEVASDMVQQHAQHLMPISQALQQLHFPDSEDLVVKARERLALEELLGLMHHSRKLKKHWKHAHHAVPITHGNQLVPSTVPFTLTPSQHRSLQEIMTDLTQTHPMNRLLVGDVGSGKTVVAGSAGWHTLQAGRHVALIAPTRILAEQHLQTLRKLFPDMPVELVITQPGQRQAFKLPSQPTFLVGTHALLPKLGPLQPGLVIYDEQHRFGVKQRSGEEELDFHPHVLTMSATPIPRSLMLTIFSHLSLSTIDELPAGRLPTKTWLTPDHKRLDSYTWLKTQLLTAKATHQALQILIVCPFIDPAQTDALSNVAAVNDKVSEIQTALGDVARIAALHGRQTKKDQAAITEQLFNQEIDVLVTTPIVEVGIDLPAANIMVIEGAERFGLASLHQLRGRVGRAGQQGYCLLFKTSGSSTSSDERLEKFAKITNGQQLAELDLEYRGAGDLFGTQQHGFNGLRFANWSNTELIHQAQTIFANLDTQILSTLLLKPHPDQPSIAAN